MTFREFRINERKYIKTIRHNNVLCIQWLTPDIDISSVTL